MRRTSVALAVILLFLVVFVQPAGAATKNVSIKDGPSRYQPSTVTIAKGDKVKWTNNGNRAHTVSKNGGGWTSGSIPVGGTFTRTFLVKGTFGYHCNFHSGMKGTVVVT